MTADACAPAADVADGGDGAAAVVLAGRDVAGPAYERLLATCYDTIHAGDPDATVIGMGLSPRASTRRSNSMSLL